MLRDEEQSRKELEKAKGYTDNIIKSMIDPLIVVNPDATIRTVNQATLELLGYKEDELIGKPVAMIFEEEESLFKGNRLKRLIKKGYLRNYNMTCLTRNRRRIPVSFSGSVMRDKDGKFTGIVGIGRDMRERLQIEEEVRIRHQAIETSTSGIAITDMKGRLTDVNWAFLFLFGYKKKKDVIGKSITSFWAQESDRQVKDLAKAIKREGLWKGELTGLHKDRTEFWVDVNASLLLDRIDRPIGMTYFLTDITERKLTEEKIRETSKMSALGQFVAGAAHEINNPLSIMTMVTQDLISRFKKASPEEFSQKDLHGLIEDLEMINKQGMRCGGITQRLLAFGRREKNVEKVPTSINKVLGEVLRMISHRLELSNIKVINKRGRLPSVLANSSLMNQVFMNILLNAYQSMPRGGKLKLKSEKLKAGNKDWVRVEIADTGEGISKENLEKIFEPFFTTRKSGTGTGLGLSIAYSIVKEHGGNISIESKLGKGTTVSITLPAIQT